MSTGVAWIILFAAAIAELAGQIALKRGSSNLDETLGPVAFIRALLAEAKIRIAMLLLALWLVGYLAALTVLPVSAAFPAQSINAFLLVVVSRLILKESVSASRWAGAVAIAVGVWLVSGA